MLGGPTPFSGQILHPSATGTKLKIHSLNADIPNAPKKNSILTEVHCLWKRKFYYFKAMPIAKVNDEIWVTKREKTIYI